MLVILALHWDIKFSRRGRRATIKGGLPCVWKEDHQGFEVELAKILMPNLLTFQLVTGNEQFYCMGVYLPPTDTMGVEDLRAAWEACLEGYMPLVLGDLNNNFSEPRDERTRLFTI